MLNYRRLCRYSESEKRLVISALEVKHFSNGTSDVERGLRLFRWKRDRNMKVQYLASCLRWGSGYLGLSPDFTLKTALNDMPAQPEALCPTSHMWSLQPSSKVIAPFVPRPLSQRRSWHFKILSSMDGGKGWDLNTEPLISGTYDSHDASLVYCTVLKPFLLTIS